MRAHHQHSAASGRGQSDRTGRGTVVLAAALLLVLALWWRGWFAPDGVLGSRLPWAVPREAVLSPAVQQRLARIPVREKAHGQAYRREAFGQAWADVDRNGCDTRNDVLARDLRGTVFKNGQHCAVGSGVLADPYTGREISFRAGPRSKDVQIDHVVALADAWASGAQDWDAAARLRFANDPRNLLAVDGPANQEKGSADASAWLPANRGYRCAYVSRQILVKAEYGLAVTPREKEAMLRELARCPNFDPGG